MTDARCTSRPSSFLFWRRHGRNSQCPSGVTLTGGRRPQRASSLPSVTPSPPRKNPNATARTRSPMLPGR
eukprot:342377-Alexandrium_andersonii.AAC.1